MKFSEKLKKAMQQLGLNQAQVVGMTGKSKGSISMYLNDKTTPSEEVQSDIAVSLGLAPDYFEQEEAQVVVIPKGAVAEGRIKRMLPEMSKEDQNYLLGYGEGMAAALKKRESDGEEDGRTENF